MAPRLRDRAAAVKVLGERAAGLPGVLARALRPVARKDLSLEHQVLLRLARLQLSGDDGDFVRQQAKAVNWERLALLATRGGIGGLVARSLERLPGVAVPMAVRRLLVVVSLQTLQQNRVLLEEMLRLAAAAAARGLNLIPLKGAALNLDLPYDDWGLRAMCDLDLLTRRDQLSEVERWLLGEGYAARDVREDLLRFSHHLRLSKEIGCTEVSLELHWTALRSLYGNARDDAEVLKRSVLHRYRGQELRVLGADDLMLALVLHLADHRFRIQPKWAVDITEVARSAQLCWPAIERRLARLGALRRYAYVAELCRELFDAPLPPAPPAPLAVALFRLLNPPSQLLESVSGHPLYERALYNLLLLNFDSLAGGLRHLARSKLPELLERYTPLQAPQALTRPAPDEAPRS